MDRERDVNSAAASRREFPASGALATARPKLARPAPASSSFELRQSFALGPAGVFLKHDSPALLAKSVREIAGRSWMDQNLFRDVLQGPSSLDRAARSKSFTTRERETLQYLLEGLSNKEIAGKFSISESAVKATLQQLFNKTEVRTRSQLVRIALEQYRDER